MKNLYYINLISILLLIISSFFNIMLLVIGFIPLGIIQVISSFYLVDKRNSLSLKNQKLLAGYYFSIFGWLFLILLGTLLPNNLQYLVKPLSYFPIGIAIYFLIITYIFYKES